MTEDNLDTSLQDDFFLPDLCETNSILFLVLVTELLVVVMVLSWSNLASFDWLDLGLASLFVQWTVLSAAFLLCNLRPLLARMTTAMATATGYGLILVVTLLYSVAAEWFLLDPGSGWGGEQIGRIGRNMLMAVVMTGIALRYLYLQHQLRRKEQAELNSRIQALQSRIRPHFLFNSMNIIASLIMVDPDTAEEVVEDLSVLFRASLNDSSDRPVLLSEELSLCQKYLHIEGLRLDERLNVEWAVNVDSDAVTIPMLTLQPLLENAVYHGIQPLPEGGTVHVNVDQEGPLLVIRIRNPLTRNGPTHSDGNRMALDNIRSRLDAIYGPDASLAVEEGADYYLTTVSYPSSTRQVV